MADLETTGWRRLVSVSQAGRTALACALVLGLPLLGAGLFMDDYFQQLVVEGNSPLPGSRWDVFTMSPHDPALVQPNIEKGPFMWWMRPTTYFVFVRPLSVALLNLDVSLFGRALWLQHLHSLAWYLALVAVVTALLRRALGASSSVGALAAVLFALDGSHGVLAGWLANRNALVAAVPALLGVLAHVRWRESKDWRFLPLSLLGYATGLAGGEAALGVLAYLLAYELTLAPPPWRARALALAPVAVLGVGYLLLYRALGAGTHGSELYVDPVHAPLTFLAQGPAKAVTLAGSTVMGQSANLWMAGARAPATAAGALGVLVMAVLVRRVWARLEEAERRGLRFLTLGAVMSLLPVLATFPMSRLTLVASVGGSALVAAVLHHGWSAAGDAWTRFGARFLFTTTVALAALSWPLTALGIRLGGDSTSRSALATSVPDEALSGRVFVLVAPDASVAMYGEMVRRWNGKLPAKAWVTLSFAPHAHRLHRTAPDTVELEVIDGRFLETVFEQLFRDATDPVPLGMQVRLAGADLTVVALDRGLPRRIRLHFDENPESGSVTIVTFAREGLVPVALPPVGQSLELPRVTTLLSM